MTEILLFCAGLLAGALNTLAGGGSFIVFPALLFAGVPPVLANASNTYAALPGYMSGVIGLWPHLWRHKQRLVAYSVASLIGGYLGAELLLHVSDDQFSAVVPWFLLFAAVLFAFGGRINAFVAQRAGGRRGMAQAGAVLLLLLLVVVSVYGGFFNAGFGILLLAFLAVAGMTDIHGMNGLKLWISSTVALIAVIRFAAEGSIDWYFGSIALVGVTLGAYVAARLAHRVPAKALRWTIIVYSFGLTGYFFWKTYWG